MIIQSQTSTNLLRVIPYTGGGSYNPTTQNGDMLLVIGNITGTADSGKILNIVPHSNTASGLRMNGVNNTFSGSLTVTNNVSSMGVFCTNLSCTNLYSFINTSIITQCGNYNSSLVSFINTSIVNSQTNLLNITNLSVNNASFNNANILTLKSGTGNITTVNCSAINIVDSTGNAMVLGTGPNAWLFNTYPFAALNGCFLGIRSNAIGGSWSNTLFSLDCFGSLTLNNGLVCKNIQVNPSTSSPNANYIGYSNMVFTSGITYLPGTGLYTNVLSISLPYKGTYDCDISFPYNFVTGSSTNNTLQYCISTSSSGADSGVSNYVSLFNTTASFPQATITFTFRRIIYVSSATTVYFIANFWGGSGCVGNIINPTYLRYTRIA
jgi:hypothetical protein